MSNNKDERFGCMWCGEELENQSFVNGKFKFFECKNDRCVAFGVVLPRSMATRFPVPAELALWELEYAFQPNGPESEMQTFRPPGESGLYVSLEAALKDGRKYFKGLNTDGNFYWEAVPIVLKFKGRA